MVIHVVQSGETVRDIARQYGVSSQRIISDNAIADETRLVVGQALVILQPETVHIVRACGRTTPGWPRAADSGPAMAWLCSFRAKSGAR